MVSQERLLRRLLLCFVFLYSRSFSRIRFRCVWHTVWTSVIVSLLTSCPLLAVINNCSERRLLAVMFEFKSFV
jgi:hypothetical protein